MTKERGRARAGHKIEQLNPGPLNRRVGVRTETAAAYRQHLAVRGKGQYRHISGAVLRQQPAPAVNSWNQRWLTSVQLFTWIWQSELE